MSRLLVTQSLLSSWAYMFDCYEGCEDDAKNDFVATLRREQTPPNEAMQNGIDFENLVYSISSGSFCPKFCEEGINPITGEAEGHLVYPKWYTGAKKVADIIMGAPVQVKTSCPLTVDGQDFLLYGILDSLKAGTIYDVKFLNSSMGGSDLYGKYLDSPQHPAYFRLIPEANNFKYLVSDGQDIYIEEYTRKQTRPIEEFIHEFFSSISGTEFEKLYRENWEAR